MRYTIVEANSADALVIRVNEYIRDGWVPLGGHAIELPNGGRQASRYSQAVTHPDLPPDDDESGGEDTP